MEQSHFRTTRIITIIVFWSGFILLACLPDSVVTNAKYTVCLHRSLFGLECPLCGMTRALHYAGRFDLVNAIRYNYVVLPLLLYFLTESVMLILHRSYALSRIILFCTLTAFLIIYIQRLTPLFF